MQLRNAITVVEIVNKCSAVAEMGDRLVTIDMDRNWGLCPSGGGGAGSPSNTMSPGTRPTSLPTGNLIYPTVTTADMGRKLGAVPNWGGELGPHLIQCRLGRGLALPTSILIHPAVWPKYIHAYIHTY